MSENTALAERTDVAFGDLNLLLTFGGHQRSEREFRALFAAAGLYVMNVLLTKSHFKIVEGAPIREEHE
jgi:hypothetical protein